MKSVWLLAFAAGCTPSASIGELDLGDSALSAVEPDAGAPSSDCIPGALSADTIRALREAASPQGTWLYPYDQTVMPRGVGAPRLMWEGVQAEAVLLRVRGKSFVYETCGLPDAADAFTPTQLSWSRIETASGGREDPLTLELRVVGAGQASTLPPRTLTLASETLQGSLYYMAYGSKLAPLGATGVIYRMPLAGSPSMVAAPLSCAGCHAVSANGRTLLAYADGLDHEYAWNGGGFDVALTPAPNAELAALTPDGSMYVASSRSSAFGPRFYGPASVQEAALVETASGNVQSNSGLPAGVLMPAFSADGSSLVFSDAALAGRGISMLQYDAAQRSFSGYRTLYQDETSYPGWPTLFPSRSAVIFALGTRNDYSGNGALLTPGTGAGPISDLYLTVLSDPSVSILLDRAMGFASPVDAAGDRTYLPFGAEELHQNYDPQVASVTTDGFSWVFFDSVRHYGNLGLQRKIWCAAIDEAYQSHPAFYVRGQDGDVSTFRPIFASDAR